MLRFDSPPASNQELQAVANSQQALLGLGIETINLEKVSGSSLEDIKLMSEFSSLAYYSNKEKQLEEREELHANGYRTQILRDSESDMQAAIGKKDNNIYISFRGTKTTDHVLKDLDAALTSSGFMSGRVHKGFYHGFQDIWPGISNTLDALASQEGKSLKDYNIHCTGHSMGGALAKIAALYMKKEWNLDRNKMKVATFGDPRVFDIRQANEYDKLLGGRTLRVAQVGKDPIPSALPGSIGFKHVGARIKVNVPKGFKVHRLKGYKAGIKELGKDNFIDSRKISVYYGVSQFFRIIIDLIPEHLRHLVKKTRKLLGRKSWHETQEKPESLKPRKAQEKRSPLKPQTQEKQWSYETQKKQGPLKPQPSPKIQSKKDRESKQR